MSARIVVLASPKGGTGKTIIAVHLAAALLAAGRRVLMVDCDVATAGLSVYLRPGNALEFNAPLRNSIIDSFEDWLRKGLCPSRSEVAARASMDDAVKSDRLDESDRLALQRLEPARIDPLVFGALDSPTGSTTIGMIYPCKTLWGEEPSAEADKKRCFALFFCEHIGAIARNGDYDHIIVDTRGGADFISVTAAALADHFVLVTEYNPTAEKQLVQLAQRILDSKPLVTECCPEHREHEPVWPKSVSIVVNKVMLTAAAKRAALNVAKQRLPQEKGEHDGRFYDSGVYVVPLEDSVVEAYRGNGLISADSLGSRFATEMLRLANHVFDPGTWGQAGVSARERLQRNAEIALRLRKRQEWLQLWTDVIPPWVAVFTGLFLLVMLSSLQYLVGARNSVGFWDWTRWLILGTALVPLSLGLLRIVSAWALARARILKQPFLPPRRVFITVFLIAVSVYGSYLALWKEGPVLKDPLLVAERDEALREVAKKVHELESTRSELSEARRESDEVRRQEESSRRFGTASWQLFLSSLSQVEALEGDNADIAQRERALLEERRNGWARIHMSLPEVGTALGLGDQASVDLILEQMFSGQFVAEGYPRVLRFLVKDQAEMNGSCTTGAAQALARSEDDATDRVGDVDYALLDWGELAYMNEHFEWARLFLETALRFPDCGWRIPDQFHESVIYLAASLLRSGDAREARALTASAVERWDDRLPELSQVLGERVKRAAWIARSGLSADVQTKFEEDVVGPIRTALGISQ